MNGGERLKLSTKGRYGIHAMYDLAQCGQAEPQPLRAIAARQGVPEAYLAQLLVALRRAKLVKGVRGAQGGYLLARSPKDITVGDVLRTLEGELAQVDCLSQEDLCDKACVCPTRLVWQKVQEGLNGIVDGITLQDMLDDQMRMTNSPAEVGEPVGERATSQGTSCK